MPVSTVLVHELFSLIPAHLIGTRADARTSGALKCFSFFACLKKKKQWKTRALLVLNIVDNVIFV